MVLHNKCNVQAVCRGLLSSNYIQHHLKRLLPLPDHNNQIQSCHNEVSLYFFLMLMAEQFIFCKNQNKGNMRTDFKAPVLIRHTTPLKRHKAILGAKSQMDLSKSRFSPGLPTNMNRRAQSIIIFFFFFGFTCASQEQSVTVLVTPLATESIWPLADCIWQAMQCKTGHINPVELFVYWHNDAVI